MGKHYLHGFDIDHWYARAQDYLNSFDVQCAARREEAALSRLRFAGWTREYNRRKALEQSIIDRDRIENLENENRCKQILKLQNIVDESRRRKRRILDLEKENAALEGENRDLGSRILDLTKKLTAANDEVGRLVEKKYYSYYQG